jgi:hypothetical protein
MSKDEGTNDNLALDIMTANPALTGYQVFEYVRRIINAEIRDDYILVNKIMHEAFYGLGVQKPAA